jgi:osmotically-inducible protein OsmY
MKKDITIREDVMAEIRLSPQLTGIAQQIGVAVKNEVVTLSGTVDHYFQRVAAEDAAQRVAGVRVVAVDIEVSDIEIPEPKTDTQIAEAVRSALTWHSAVNDDLINITVDNGWVYLEGMANWDYERRAAENSVKNIVGVRGVVNSIKINTKGVDPLQIKKEISAAFHRHASVDSSTISVNVSGSKVELTGKVRSLTERKDAEDVAWSMAGVKEVENLLKINTEIYAGE